MFLGQRKLYEAANEFEWAKKLLPGHPDPRVNLARTLEEAGASGKRKRDHRGTLKRDHLELRSWSGVQGAEPPACGAKLRVLGHRRRDDDGS